VKKAYVKEVSRRSDKGFVAKVVKDRLDELEARIEGLCKK
jgi:hypothetical protein